MGAKLELTHLHFVKLDPKAELPQKAHYCDACADIKTIETHTLAPGEQYPFRTGLSPEFPAHIWLQIFARSGLAFKRQVTIPNAPGVIDPGYRGEIMILLWNYGNEPQTIIAGDRVAQIVPRITVDIVSKEVNRDIQATTVRGKGGFGSSGR